jgi:hypothetical protein
MGDIEPYQRVDFTRLANYGTPNRFVNTPQFGTITEAATPVSQIQFVVRARNVYSRWCRSVLRELSGEVDLSV